MSELSRKAKSWIEAMRLRTLPVSIAGVFSGWGCAAAYGNFRVAPALICLVFAIVAQIVSNFANEYFDFKNGLDKKGREGFRRGVTEGDISPASMRNVTFILLFADALLGCSLIAWGGWLILPVGIAIVLFALAYSTGPYPLSHHGWGEVAVIFFFGLIPVCFTAYLVNGSWQTICTALPLSIAIGLMGANVLMVNNYRDADDDKAVGKKTIAVRFGRKRTAQAYLISSVLAAISGGYAVLTVLNPWWLILVAAVLALHINLYRKIMASEGKELNPLLGQTAVLMSAYSIILAIGMTFRPVAGAV